MMVMDWWKNLAESLSHETRLRENEPLATKTTMRVGGPARYYAEPSNVDDLVALRKAAREASVSVFYMGRGSNLIVMDTGFPGLVIRLTGENWQRISIEGDEVHAAAGARLKQICAVAAGAGFAGYEFMEGIPGALGGSLRMNAGAMGGWIFDLVRAVICLEEDDSVVEQPASFFEVGYRSCPQLKHRIVLGARLCSSQKGSAPAIRDSMGAYASKRKKSQPREPSAGCIFKNPEPRRAGELVDLTGLKGLRIGGAEVSSTHANFIVNRGGATTTDVLELVRTIRERVRKAHGMDLEPEALLLGANWEDVL